MPFYDLKKLPDLPVLLGTWYEGFKFVEQGEQYVREVHDLLGAQQSPVFYVLDFTPLHTMSIEGAMRSADSGARGPNPNLHHPMNCGNIFVSKAELVKMTAKGMRGPTYGNLDIKVFDTLDEALAYVEGEVLAGRG